MSSYDSEEFRIMFGELTPEEKFEVETSALKLELDEYKVMNNRQVEIITSLEKQCAAKDDAIKRAERRECIIIQNRKAAQVQRDEANAALERVKKQLAQAQQERDTAKSDLSWWISAHTSLTKEIEHLRNRKPSDMEEFEALQIVARLRREKLAILGDYAAVLASIYEENPEQTRFMEVLEDLTEQMNETIQDLKEGGE